MKVMKDANEQAEDLLISVQTRWPGVDRSELLKRIVTLCFHRLRYGGGADVDAAYTFLKYFVNTADDAREIMGKPEVAK